MMEYHLNIMSITLSNYNIIGYTEFNLFLKDTAWIPGL